MPQAPDWKRLLETGMQFTEMRRSQARELASELVAQGHLARDQLAATVDELMEMSRRRTEALRAMVRGEVQRQLRALGIATKDDLVALERRLSKPRAAPAKKAAAKKAPTKTPAAEPAASKAG